VLQHQGGFFLILSLLTTVSYRHHALISVSTHGYKFILAPTTIPMLLKGSRTAI
jgi:hypothetical protein